MTAGARQVPRPSLVRVESEPGEPAGSSQERVGSVGRQGSVSMYLRVPLLRSASLARQGFPSAMPMAARGPASPRNERSCSRGPHRRQIRSERRRGRPRAGEASARARQSRDARTLRRHDSSPPGEGEADPRRGRWGLVAAPWERRRITARTGVANGRVEHPTRAAPAGGQVSAADAPPGDRAHPTRSHLAGRHGARHTNGARRPSHGREPQGTHRGAGRFDPPAGSRTYRRSQVSRISAPRRAPRLRGCTARKVALQASARRAPAGGTALDEVSR